MKSSPIKIGLILFIIYLVAQGIYRCNMYDCLNLKKELGVLVLVLEPFPN